MATFIGNTMSKDYSHLRELINPQDCTQPRVIKDYTIAWYISNTQTISQFADIVSNSGLMDTFNDIEHSNTVFAPMDDTYLMKNIYTQKGVSKQLVESLTLRRSIIFNSGIVMDYVSLHNSPLSVSTTNNNIISVGDNMEIVKTLVCINGIIYFVKGIDIPYFI
jgi:hypothetical protein